MASNKGIITLIIALTIGAVFFIPVANLVGGATDVQTVSNEAVTDNVQFDQTYQLDGYNVESGSETLEVDNGTDWVTLSEGTDYEINTERGTVDFVDSSNLDAGDTVRASYDWQQTDGTTASVVGLIPLMLALMLLVPIANRVSEGV